MLFNSWNFAAFLLGCLSIYPLLHRRLRLQNAMLLAASYIFYGSWDWRFLSLIVLSTLVDFTAGLRIQQSEGPSRKRWLMLSMVTNLGLLAVFKYFDFFVASFVDMGQAVGLSLSASSLKIILPVGISFYTFQTMSYTIDIYRRELKPTRSLLNFSLFVAFFPQLVAGPIERAKHLLPQVEKARKFNLGQFEAGAFLMLWGLFKKTVVADNAGLIADRIFQAPGDYSGVDLTLGALAFTAQIYGDFSGYSDIARGIAKVLGFDLLLNFKLPYFARTPSEFWRRWHVSLSQWLRDYLYISLGGNRFSRRKTQRNLVLTMLLGGLWHGAAWHFVVWGAYHGLLLIVYRPIEGWLLTHKRHEGTRAGYRLGLALRDVALIGVMFAFTVIGWVIFRCDSMDQITYFITNMGVVASEHSSTMASRLFLCVCPLLVVQVWQWGKDDLLAPLHLPTLLKAPLYALLICAMMVFGVRESTEFIYFQF